MVNWFWKRRRPTRVLRLRARGDMGDAQRVDFAELAPEASTFLGQAAYLQLGYFETLGRLVRATPGLAEKEAISLAAGRALRKHRQLVDVISDRVGEPTEVMEPFREQLDAFRGKTIGARPRETMLSVHITAGMLDDFYLALASSYGETGRRVEKILGEASDREQIEELLRETIAGDDEWRDLLSMWARRLVGDTLLIARSALVPERLASDQERVEPVFTALMAAHARRMDALGLNA
ncbi:ferritin-like fold-containing protein [Microbacterium halophytorum]|uniref:ferritin-like fold-containing protein n=1 Tax=Microbacterium halophytorum TaxID=2067568 RepID=UPI000CFB17E7|nr:ferritin-like fold-containing protein [Microbacterium halophytorum]